MQEPIQWSKGEHEDYSAFVIEIHVRKDKHGALQTRRTLQDAADHAVVEQMGANGGMEEGAWALLSEAARAEMLLQVLVKLSNSPEFKAKLTGDPEPDDELIEKLSNDTLEQMRRGLEAVVPSFARETVQMVRDGLRHQTG
jgi:hypothetical protein